MCTAGEHILSFAACAGNEDIISMVIDAGASTRVQDYRGMKFNIWQESTILCHTRASVRYLKF